MNSNSSFATRAGAPRDRIAHPPTVAEIMTTDVATCRADDAVNRCAQLMWERACGSVPIVDDDGRPLSIITDRDICMAAYLQGRPLTEISAASAMSKRLVTIRETATVSTAEAAMRRHGVRRLLVVDAAGRLVGLLSIDDILKRADDGPVRSKDPFSEEAIAATVAALGYAYTPARP